MIIKAILIVVFVVPIVAASIVGVWMAMDMQQKEDERNVRVP